MKTKFCPKFAFPPIKIRFHLNIIQHFLMYYCILDVLLPASENKGDSLKIAGGCSKNTCKNLGEVMDVHCTARCFLIPAPSTQAPASPSSQETRCVSVRGLVTMERTVGWVSPLEASVPAPASTFASAPTLVPAPPDQCIDTDPALDHDSTHAPTLSFKIRHKFEGHLEKNHVMQLIREVAKNELFFIQS